MPRRRSVTIWPPTERNVGRAYLRDQGLYSSQTTEWRKLRDAGVLDEKNPIEKIVRLTPDHVEIGRLRWKLDTVERRLVRTEAVLVILRKRVLGRTHHWCCVGSSKPPCTRSANGHLSLGGGLRPSAGPNLRSAADEGICLCSVSTTYRLLTENQHVKEHRQLAASFG